jgi:prophage regulatory protein
MERLLRKDELRKVTGLSWRTLCRMVDAGDFPRPYRLGIRSIAWKESEVDRWVASRPVSGNKKVNASRDK